MNQRINAHVHVPVLNLRIRCPALVEYEWISGPEPGPEIQNVEICIGGDYGDVEWRAVEPTEDMENELIEQIFTERWADYADYERDRQRDSA